MHAQHLRGTTAATRTRLDVASAAATRQAPVNVSTVQAVREPRAITCKVRLTHCRVDGDQVPSLFQRRLVASRSSRHRLYRCQASERALSKGSGAHACAQLSCALLQAADTVQLIDSASAHACTLRGAGCGRGARRAGRRRAGCTITISLPIHATDLVRCIQERRGAP